MESASCAPAHTAPRRAEDSTEAQDDDRRRGRSRANRVVTVTLGLGTALAAGLPKLLGVAYSTFGPPEVLLVVAGLTLAAWAAIGLWRAPAPDGSTRLAEIEAEMTGGHAFLVGVGVGLPLLRFFGRLVIETDSARILASVVHARNYGYVNVRESQEALLPHLVYRPVLALAGLPGTRAVAVVSAVVLVGTVAFIAWRTTASLVVTLGAAVAITAMRFTLAQTPLLPLYPLMLAAGYTGGYLLWRASRADGRSRVWLTVGGVLAIAAAPELHSLGQLFYATPLIVAILAPAGRRLLPTVVTYAALLVATIPRLAINLSEGGLKYVRSGRVEWFVQQGYLDLVNQQRNQTPSHAGYLKAGPELLADALGGWGFVWIALAALALIFVSWRVRFAVIASAAIVVGALVVQRPGPFPRYLSPLIPGIAILLGVLLAAIVSQPRRAVRVLAVPLIALVVVSGVRDYGDGLDRVHTQESARGAGRLQTMADLVGTDSVFGVRAPKLIGYNADLDPWGLSFVTEEEFRIYLRWPWTKRVVDMLEARGIEYVAVTDRTANEVDYHAIWLGEMPRHPRRLIDSSGQLCPVWHEFPLALYRVGPCQPGDEGSIDADR